MIQCSSATAALVKSGGKDGWLKEREDLVVAKGKGEMQTYWILARDRSYATRSSVSSESGMESLMIDRASTHLEDSDVASTAGDSNPLSSSQHGGGAQMAEGIQQYEEEGRMAKLEEMIEVRRRMVADHESGHRKLSDEEYMCAKKQFGNLQRKLEQMRNRKGKGDTGGKIGGNKLTTNNQRSPPLLMKSLWL